MIRSFKDRRTEAVFKGESPKGFPSDLVKVARRKLRMIHRAVRLEDLRAPPANRLETLKGDRQGQHSIRINDQFRICFTWSENDASNVEVTDYHCTRNHPLSLDTATMPSPQVLPPLHPGEVLREEFMIPLGLTAYAVAKACRVPRTRIERIAREEIGITADTALRLSKFFGTSAEFWLSLQADYDMETARAKISAELETIQKREMEKA